MFDVKKYRRQLKTQWLGQTVSYFEKLDSTNSYLKKLSKQEVTHGHLCLTDHQTKGRGQYERNWESGDGMNLTFTLAFHPSKPERFHILTLACARAAVAQIESETNCKAFIKWPNDILINGKKMSGLLTEAVFSGNKLDRLLVGMGLNINQVQFPNEIQRKATSLKNEAGVAVNREDFLSALFSRIEFAYTRWHKQNDELLKWINQKIIGYGNWVRLRVNGSDHSDKFKLLGVDNKGKLAVIDAEGGIQTFSYEQVRVIPD